MESRLAKELRSTGSKQIRIGLLGGPKSYLIGGRLKQREVALDDAIVENKLPSKIVHKSFKGMRAQENLDVEGSSKRRTRFGSVARGIKAKHPCLRKPVYGIEVEITN
ncbi:hypothetical protein RHSIM_RhsimUnG0190500 [Rhododendron simsii]|uniref:Uncharacterized protein n=1 Tax=Rhododendron simsii TaxID=118357 RepID=A0A834FVX6_RHOSS|nr:hypothetical protein RHSIM_RhsimUnG0190500 [Rhododendron simsii]